MCTNTICERKETHYPPHNSHRKIPTKFPLSRFVKLIAFIINLRPNFKIDGSLNDIRSPLFSYIFDYMRLKLRA